MEVAAGTARAGFPLGWSVARLPGPIDVEMARRKAARAATEISPQSSSAPRSHSFDSSFNSIACTGEPGPIFCKLPVMMRSPSLKPLTTLTSSPSAGPSVTSRNSALSPAPTT